MKINELPITPILDNSDKFIVIQNNSATKQAGLDDIATHVLTESKISTLSTDSKKPIGAINEVVQKLDALDERVSELEKMGSGLRKIKLDLNIVDLSGSEG